jgi:uncharacterized phage protein gp47/JayE
MIDPGNPFSVAYPDLIASLEDRIRNGVEQPDQRTFIFKSTVTTYELPANAFAITQVSGLVKSQFRVFEPGTDYGFSANRLIWLNPLVLPDDGSRLDVEFTYREPPPGITDFNPGSVIGTLVRSVAREMKLLYEQMDQAYRRAFIDQASGVALDNVVALLGETRKPAIKAVGTVTFFRKTPPPKTILIPRGTRVADQAGRVFVTTADGSLPPAAPIDETANQNAGVVKAQRVIAELTGIWKAADNPDTAAPFPVKPGFGTDGQSITLDLAPAALPTGPLRIRYRPASAIIPIEAQQAGPDGNVNAATITIMPTPPPGVDGVTNESATGNGQDAEADDPLRERAKHALERAGNATTNAIKFAVLEVKGVEGVEVIDHDVDDSVPLGEVRVRYTGGDVTDIRQVVEKTRAAGIIARLEQIVEVFISGTFYLIPTDATPPPASSLASFMSKVLAMIQAQTIGSPLPVKRLNSLVFDLPGLADVAEAVLTFEKADLAHPGSFLTGDVGDPFVIASTEIIRADPAGLQTSVLTALKSPANHKTSSMTVTIDVQLADSNGAAVKFRHFSVNLGVIVRAYSINNPDQAPERIANFTRVVTFTASATAPLNILPADLTGFRPADHKPELDFLITAAAYPSLQQALAKVNVS